MRLRRCLLASLLTLPMLAMSPAQGAAQGSATFIVTLQDAASPRAVAAEHARKFGAEVKYVYEHALRGYAAKVSEAKIGQLASDKRVVRIERDGVVHASATQSNAPWGLDRIDQRSGTDGTYTTSATGSGVRAYIIDTGILTTHTDFGGRAVHGWDTVDNDANATDCNGHGTHVAGTVGGKDYGVAKGVDLVAVRVLNCSGSGTWSGVIAGMDWVTNHHVKPAVANMSLGGGASDSVDEAVRRMIAAGVATAVAAGNGNAGGKAQDACNYSPARVQEAMTIGATTKTDSKTSWSNYGSCVDWFAPGYQITSAWHTGDTATNTISGTSMASPHVAGVAALYLQNQLTATPLIVRDALYSFTTKNVVTSSSTANNHLLYSLPLEQKETVEGGGGGTSPGPGNGKGSGKKSVR